MLTRAQWGWLVFALALAGLVVVLVTRLSEPRPTPGVDFSTEQLLDSTIVSLPKVKEYVNKLHFVERLGPSDLRHVDLEQDKRDTVKGVLVWIQPEEGSYRLVEADRKQGRFIAQIWSDTLYPRLGLEAGWNWWWVGELRDSMVSVFVSEGTGKRTPKPLKVVKHYRWDEPYDIWTQAIARLVPGTVRTWGTCGGDACCQS